MIDCTERPQPEVNDGLAGEGQESMPRTAE